MVKHKIHSKRFDQDTIYKILLAIGKKISDNKEGALFIIGPEGKFKGKYELLYPQFLAKTRIDSKGFDEVLVKLAELDGAFLISDKGYVLTFGARIRQSIAIRGHGTKHAAAAGITKTIPEATAILVSEETGWVRVFQKGKIVLEVDPKANASPSMRDKIVHFITDRDTALLTAAGASAAILGAFPVVIVTGTYLVIKTATGIIRKHFKNN